MRPALVYALPGGEALARAVVAHGGAEAGELALHRFPDGETGVRLQTLPQDHSVVLAARLDDPDPRMAALHFIATTLREHGAQRIVLAAPYLPYMRQDRAFAPGVGTLARHYARWLSALFDGLVTVDPHLHRIHELDEIYTIPTQRIAAAPAIAEWIAGHCTQPPLLVGPDEESQQWIAAVAAPLGCPHTHFTKERRGDADIRLRTENLAAYAGRRVVILDDIVSTAATMIGAAEAVQRAGFATPICIAVHALFAGDAYARLQATGAQIVSCNTVPHPSNGIDLSPRLAAAISTLLAHGDNGAVIPVRNTELPP